MAIERDLHELLYAHDCVIVPRFGGFLTHYRPARLDEQRRSIHPPSKDLSFNRHLIRTDGLLTDHVAKVDGLDFNQATAVIDGEVDAWQSKLDRDGRLELPRIGTFYRDAERNLQFDPDRRVNFLKDSYGLRPVAALPCAVTAPAPAPSLPEPNVIRLDPEVSTTEGKFPWLAAASVAVLMMTAGTWWIVTSRSPSGAQMSGFELFTTAEPGIYRPRDADGGAGLGPVDTTIWQLPVNLNGTHEIPLPGDPSATMIVDLGLPEKAESPTLPVVPEKQVAVPESTAVAVPSPQSRFHIIGGCFLLEENAESFMANLRAKGFAASIIDKKGGLFRVAIGSYPQRGLALEALAAVRKEEAPQAWLLIR